MSTITKDKKLSDITVGEFQELIEDTINKKLEMILTDSYWGVRADQAGRDGFLGHKESDALLKGLIDAED